VTDDTARNGQLAVTPTESRGKTGIKRTITGLRKLRRPMPADVDIVQMVREDRESGRSLPTFHHSRELKLAMATLRDELALVAKGELRVSKAVRTAMQTRLAAMRDEMARSARRTGSPIVTGVKLPPNRSMLPATDGVEPAEADRVTLRQRFADGFRAAEIDRLGKKVFGIQPKPRKSPIDPEMRAMALSAFLEKWEREHGPFTSAELHRAAEDLTRKARSRAYSITRSYSDHMLFHDLLSVVFHGLAAQKILKDPLLIERARNTLERWISKEQRVPQPFIEWRQILAGTPQEIAAVATALTEEATRLRSSSPLGCLITQNERAAVRALLGKGRPIPRR
jgi:hypothetical protein